MPAAIPPLPSDNAALTGDGRAPRFWLHDGGRRQEQSFTFDAGGHVSVSGKVKFYNETKGYAYDDLLSDLAALA